MENTIKSIRYIQTMVLDSHFNSPQWFLAFSVGSFWVNIHIAPKFLRARVTVAGGEFVSGASA